jgi:type I restriction enzyme S subunit
MRYTIGQLAEIIDGDRGKNYPKQDEFYPQGYCLFLNTGNVTKEGLIFEENQFIMKEKDEALRKGKLKRGDIVYTTRGTVGNAGYYNSSVPYENVRINSGMVILRSNGEIVDARFLYQILKSEYYRPYFKQYCTGSAQPQLPIKNFSQIYLNVPDIKTQHRIADILSVYDDLIENNQRQIKLLEEAAQRLYKEWFVNLRFPGHENTKIVDGVPEGWQWCKVRDVADINSSALPKNYKEDFIDYVDLGSVRCGHIETRTRYNLNEAPGRAKRCAKDGDIIWGMVRPNLKAYALVTNPKETDVFSTGFAVLSAKKVPYSYLYCAVTQEEFVGYLVNATNGAAYPAVKPVHFEVADILKPDDKVLEQFHSVADSIYRKKEALENQNHNLRESRDLILPKLMSGEVEV